MTPRGQQSTRHHCTNQSTRMLRIWTFDDNPMNDNENREEESLVRRVTFSSQMNDLLNAVLVLSQLIYPAGHTTHLYLCGSHDERTKVTIRINPYAAIAVRNKNSLSPTQNHFLGVVAHAHSAIKAQDDSRSAFSREA